MRIILEYITTIVFSMAHQYLSTRKSWLFGAIVPIIYVGYFFSIRVFHPQLVDDGAFSSFIIYLLIIWLDGRQTYHNNLKEKQKQNELSNDNSIIKE